MRVADLIPQSQEGWLRALLKKHPDEIARLYLIYNDRQYGPDSARDIFNSVVPEDFVAGEDSDILSNERLRVDKQQGIQRPFDQTLGGEDHQWWVEVYWDQDIWDLIKLELKAEPKKATGRKK